MATRTDLNAGFHNTLDISPDTRLRASYAYQRAKADVGITAPKYRPEKPDPLGDNLRFTARQAASLAHTHTVSAAPPQLRRAHREAANRQIHEFSRAAKSSVLATAQALHAADLENMAMLRVHEQLTKTLEYPRRVIWLADRNISARKARPNQDRDAAHALLPAERSQATALLRGLLSMLQTVNERLASLASARAAVAAELHTLKQGLHLDPDAYSGVVSTFPALLDDAPRCVHHLKHQFSASVALRADASKLLSDTVATIDATLAEVTGALSASAAASTRLARELTLARGETRVAANAAARRVHTLEIARELNEGPVQGRFLTVAEKIARPTVRAYTLARGHSAGAISQPERSTTSHAAFTRQLSAASGDHQLLKATTADLGGAVRDRLETARVDAAVVKERQRFAPHRRV